MTDRAVPFDLQAERATLGACLLDRDAIIALSGWIAPTHFMLEKHALIYEAILACYARREPPDLATVAAELRRRERLDLVGGIGFLGELADAVPTAVHVTYYAQAVERTAGLRRLIEAGGQIAALGYDEAAELPATFDAAEQTLFQVTQRAGAGALAAGSLITAEVWEHLGKREPAALSTGLTELDKHLIGWRRSRLYVAAGRPGMGKTGFGLTAMAACCRRRGRALLFSLEMDRLEVGMRLAASLAGVSSQAIEARAIDEDDLARVGHALGIVEQWDFLVSDIPGEHIASLRGKARRAHAERPLDLVIVDYLQLAEADGERRDLVVSAVVRGLKNLARELKIPVLALAQLNRAVEARASKVPQLSDLRESGEIEQAADAVLFLHRPDYYDPAERPGEADVIIAKQRNGPLATIPVAFHGPTTTFRPLVRYVAPEGY